MFTWFFPPYLIMFSTSSFSLPWILLLLLLLIIADLFSFSRPYLGWFRNQSPSLCWPLRILESFLVPFHPPFSFTLRYILCQMEKRFFFLMRGSFTSPRAGLFLFFFLLFVYSFFAKIRGPKEKTVVLKIGEWLLLLLFFFPFECRRVSFPLSPASSIRFRKNKRKHTHTHIITKIILFPSVDICFLFSLVLTDFLFRLNDKKRNNWCFIIDCLLSLQHIFHRQKKEEEVNCRLSLFHRLPGRWILLCHPSVVKSKREGNG